MEQSNEPEVNIVEEPSASEYEIAARKARAEHSSATVSLLQSLKSMNHSMKIFTGNAFVIRIDQEGGCKLITCQHLIQQNLVDDNYELWARFFGANEDAKVTVQYSSVETDIAILNVAEIPDEVKPTVLEFTRKHRVGTTSTLLGYFNPSKMEDLLQSDNPIAKSPNAVPGKICGPLTLDTLYPEKNWLISVDCYGIFGSCGSPIISHRSGKGKVVAMFKHSIEQIHFGIATKTIREQLRKWLGAPKEDTLGEMIERL